ncbi:MAG: DUF523 domain-containing protein [Deltaproteobacteria bacterium]|nr:DUF523 domain-containing protein [Deltaproteobacteria bacterium]
MRRAKENKKEVVIVSACLTGIKSRYDGTHALDRRVLSRLKGKAVVPVCPEQLGGLPTPRPRAWIKRRDGLTVLKGMSKVEDERGADVTRCFLKGAREALKIARLVNAKEAYLKEKSPSCGKGFICRGQKKVKGSGVLAALFKRKGIRVEGF